MSKYNTGAAVGFLVAFYYRMWEGVDCGGLHYTKVPKLGGTKRTRHTSDVNSSLTLVDTTSQAHLISSLKLQYSTVQLSCYVVQLSLLMFYGTDPATAPRLLQSEGLFPLQWDILCTACRLERQLDKTQTSRYEQRRYGISSECSIGLRLRRKGVVRSGYVRSQLWWSSWD